MPEYCSKCQRRKVVAYQVEPDEAWKTVVLNRWPIVSVTAQSWNDQPPPRNPCTQRR